jgi:hypothetical protein
MTPTIITPKEQTETWATLTQDRVHSPIRTTMIANMPISPIPDVQDYTETQSTQISTSQDTTTSQNLHSYANTGSIQSTLTPKKNNIPFGDLITSPKHPNSIRIAFQNVNGIQKAKSWNELKSFSHKLSTLNVDIFGAAETNLKWTFARNQQVKAILQKTHNMCSISTSSNKEESLTAYQPGGTLTAIFHKYVGRITKTIQDPTSLGRWSGFKLHTHFGHQLNILTVYQSTKSDGLHTSYQQQSHYFRTQGIQNPDPRKLLLRDLEHLIGEFNNLKEETILLIDANDGIHQRNSLLPTFLSNTNLVSLIPNTNHHPPTHARGSHCIDFIFGSHRLLDHIHASGISALYDEPWPNTDHRSLFIDVDELGLFGANLETIPPPVRRVITSKSQKTILKFHHHLTKSNMVDNLLNNLTELSKIQIWDNTHHNALEQTDQQFTNLLLQSEAKCATPVDFPWSPTIQQKAAIYQFWLTKLHGIKNNINVSDQTTKIKESLAPDEVFQGNAKRSLIKQLKYARKNLINARLKADDLREEYLEVLQEIAINEGRMSKAEAIRQLANKERQLRCWRTFKLLRKGKSIGGLTHVLVPESIHGAEILHRIYDKSQIDHTLLHRNIQHFSQADKTPFTKSPLLDILGEDGCTEAAFRILDGQVPDGLPKYPTLLLQQFQ